MEGPPLGPGGEDITWPDQVGPRGRKASSTRKIKPQTSNLSFPGTYTTLRSNLANVSCHRALLAAGPEGVSTCSLCQLCKD